MKKYGKNCTWLIVRLKDLHCTIEEIQNQFLPIRQFLVGLQIPGSLCNLIWQFLMDDDLISVLVLWFYFGFYMECPWKGLLPEKLQKYKCITKIFKSSMYCTSFIKQIKMISHIIENPNIAKSISARLTIFILN